MNRYRSTLPLALAIVVIVAGACSSDDTDDTTTTTAETTTSNPNIESEATVRFDQQIQQELADVGCNPGEVDGVIGPATDAAILEFQKAEGLTPDGELGTETDDALKSAAAAGRTVCSSAPTTTEAPASTTTTASGTAPCTAAAILTGLPEEGESLQTYICSEGFAAGTLSEGTTKFLLQSVDGAWVAPSQDPCGSASAGIPAEILEDGCDS